MEQGTVLSSQLSLHDPYPLSSDYDCSDTFAGHSIPAGYTSGGAVELRRDGGLHQSSFSFPATNSARLLSDAGLTADASRYKAGNHLTGSSSGSISTSPSSDASSLAAYNTTYSQNHYTTLPNYPNTVQQAFLPSSHAGHRFPSTSDGVLAGPLPLPTQFRSSISGTAIQGDRDSHAHYIPSIARNPLSSHGVASYTDNTRSFHPGSALPLSYSPMASSATQSYTGSQNESSAFPWPNLEVLTDMTCDGTGVTPEVHAKVEKGFFFSPGDKKWTCYRRNYFSVACNFELHPNVNNGRMFLKRSSGASNGPELIQAMGMKLSAAVDGSGGKTIELVQHTPKRDNGPKNKIDIMKVSPTGASGRGEHSVSPHSVYQVPLPTFHATGAVPGPYLPLQNSPDANLASSANGQNPQLSPSYVYANGNGHVPTHGPTTTHTFERVQFKQATANNGKRRASQQYFHLMVELFADVRKDGSDNPTWVKVAQRVSEKIVVRGRSPSHYQNEGQNGQAARGGGGGGSTYHSMSGGTYGSMNPGTFRSALGGFGNSIGPTGYQANNYRCNGSSDDSASSPGSVEGGAADSDHPMDTIMSDADRHGIHDYEGYKYYPSTLYEGIQLPVPKIETGLRCTTEPRQYGYGMKTEFSEAVPGPQWQMGDCGRFQGVDSSRGYFPDLSVGAPSYS